MLFRSREGREGGERREEGQVLQETKIIIGEEIMCKCRNIIICVQNAIYMYISISTVHGTFMGACACTMYVYVYICT